MNCTNDIGYWGSFYWEIWVGIRLCWGQEEVVNAPRNQILKYGTVVVKILFLHIEQALVNPKLVLDLLPMTTLDLVLHLNARLILGDIYLF